MSYQEDRDHDAKLANAYCEVLTMVEEKKLSSQAAMAALKVSEIAYVSNDMYGYHSIPLSCIMEFLSISTPMVAARLMNECVGAGILSAIRTTGLPTQYAFTPYRKP